MRLAGIFLLLAGWAIVIYAIVLFPQGLPRGGFVAAGMALEVVGLALVFRGHSALLKGAE